MKFTVRTSPMLVADNDQKCLANFSLAISVQSITLLTLSSRPSGASMHYDTHHLCIISFFVQMLSFVPRHDKISASNCYFKCWYQPKQMLSHANFSFMTEPCNSMMWMVGSLKHISYQKTANFTVAIIILQHFHLKDGRKISAIDLHWTKLYDGGAVSQMCSFIWMFLFLLYIFFHSFGMWECFFYYS